MICLSEKQLEVVHSALTLAVETGERALRYCLLKSPATPETQLLRRQMVSWQQMLHTIENESPYLAQVRATRALADDQQAERGDNDPRLPKGGQVGERRSDPDPGR